MKSLRVVVLLYVTTTEHMTSCLKGLVLDVGDE